MASNDDYGWGSVLKALLAGVIAAVLVFVFILNIFLGCNTSTRDD